MSQVECQALKGLYIHIPFCVKKCLYCDFYSIESPSTEVINQYLSALIKEIESQKERLSEIRTVYIGGGTPSILKPEQLSFLMDKVNLYLVPSRIIEFTVETNPGTVDRQKLRVLKEHGVTRISLGVQSFKEKELRLLGRSHSLRDIFQAIEEIKALNLDLSIDLIYGLPFQSLNDWLQNLSRAIEIDPGHVSAYELTVEEGTPFCLEISSGRIQKPSDEDIVRMYEYAVHYLEEKGYIHYEVSNFARPGRECHHNINYWKRGEYIGLGAGAHSFFEGIRRENFNDLTAYINSVNLGRLPYKKVSKLSLEDEFMELVMLGLRMKEGISIDEIPCQAFKERFISNAVPLIKEGLLERAGDIIRPTLKGFIFLNEVIIRLIR
jgi:oxygen-independent coproporphyrinogen-3 oxidase